MFRTKKKSELRNVSSEALAALQRNFNVAELAELLSLSTAATITAGQPLATQDRLGREVVVIVSGTASVLRDGQQIAQVGPGDIIGEMSILTGELRNASVVANETISAYVLSAREFTSLLDREPALHNKIAVNAVKRLAAK